MKLLSSTLPLILASGSPRRQQLLREAGINFEVKVRPIPEHVPPNLHPQDVSIRIAEDKARAFEDLAADHLIITADTIVALGVEILGKPRDDAEAFSMLQRLSGRSHQVFTGVCLFHGDRLTSFCEATQVTFRSLSKAEIQYYIEHYAPHDKAGAYGIQDWIGQVGITHIAGDYYNVMGLPVSRLYTALKQYL